MVMNMIQNYLVVENNVVTNVCAWDGNTSTWAPPQGAITLVQATTPAVVWVWVEDKQDCELKEYLGLGGIGFTWNGTQCITNQPKPNQE